MIKKIIILLALLIFSFNIINFSNTVYWAWCNYDWYWDVAGAIENCIWWDSGLVDNWSDLKVDGWFKEQLIKWIKKIATFLALWAIFSIAYGSLQMVLSTWEEEKIKKAKDIVKWWLLWFVWIISAGFIISLIVKLVYSIWNV